MATPNKKLETARLQRRWSVEVASSKVGVSINTFNRWERGLQVPQLETLDLLCTAFAMSPEELGFAHAITAKRRSRGLSTLPLTIPNDTTIQLPPPLVTPSPPLEQPIPIEATEQSSQNIGRCLEQTKTMLNTLPTDDVANNAVLRRKAITLLISTPSAVFSLTQGADALALHTEEIIALSTINLPLCWQLYFEGGIIELAHILPGYLIPLSTLVLQAPQPHKNAASLASLAHQIACLLALHNQDFGTALKHTHDAIYYGQIAEDNNIQLAATIRQAYVYLCLNHSEQRLRTYKEATRYLHGDSPLLESYLYAGLAEVYAYRGEQDIALEYLHLAKKTFPQKPEVDPSFIYTRFHRLKLYDIEGLVYLHLHRPEQAWQTFTKIDQATIPYDVEIIAHKATAAFELDDQTEACKLIALAVTTAIELGSRLYFDEASAVYEKMLKRWGNETQVQKMGELFQGGIR